MIRKADPNDIELIRSIAFEVWPKTYSDIISQSQIDYMLDLMYSHESLTRQMTEEGCVFLVAENFGPKGFSSFSKNSEQVFKLNKLYVLSTEQGKGTGKDLLNEVIRFCDLQGGESLELQVNKNNKAVQFYLKQGFEIDRELVLDIGGGFVMDDYIMKKELSVV